MNRAILCPVDVVAATVLTLSLGLHAADAPAPHACASNGRNAGFRGDGTGVYPDSHPPTRFGTHALFTENHKTAQGRRIDHNILWRADVANWGNGAPVPVEAPSSPDGSAAAGRVFVVSEPGWKHDWPVLQCFSDADGKLLWERELDHLDALSLPAEEKASTRAVWAEYWSLQRAYYSNGALIGLATNAAERDALCERFKAEGKHYKWATGWTGGGKGFIPPSVKEFKTKIDKIKATGLRLETWSVWGCGGWATYCIGFASPTPASDGERVYASTAYNAVFCYDLEGKLLWVRPQSGKPTTGHFCTTFPSPMLYGDRVVALANNVLRALDKRTGQILWEAQGDQGVPWGHSLSTPMVIASSGTEYLVGVSSSFAFRLADGQAVPIEPHFPEPSLDIAVNTDRPDTVFFIGGGNHMSSKTERSAGVNMPCAFQMEWDGKALRPKLLWHGFNGKRSEAYVGLAYRDGRLYCCGKDNSGILDAATGAVLAGPRHAPSCAHDGTWLLIAGEHVYGLSQRKGENQPEAKPVRGVVEVYDLQGRKVAENWLWTEVPSGERLERIRCQEANGTWIWFNQSGLMNVKGDRLYVRSQECLWCIGHAVRGAPGDDPAVVAAIRNAANAQVCVAHLGQASAQYRLEALKRLTVLKSALSPADSEALQKVLRADAYPEIRAAALLALDACDPAGKAGWEAFAGKLVPDLCPGRGSIYKDAHRRTELIAMFAALGPAGSSYLARHWPAAAAEPLTRAAVLDLAAGLGWRVEEPVTTTIAASERWQKDKGDLSVRILSDYYAAVDAAAEPAAAGELLKRYPGEWRLYETFARHLPRERLLAWLEPLAMASASPTRREPILSAWRRVGKDAIPAMEQCAAKLMADPQAKDAAQRADWATAIADAVLEMKGLKKPNVKEEKEARDD